MKAGFWFATKHMGGALLGVLVCCQKPVRSSEAQSAEPPQPAAAIAHMSLGSVNQTAEVAVGRYDGSGWPLTVSLATTAHSLSTLQVSWLVSSPISDPATDVDLPAGDPLEPLRGAGGWSFGTAQAASLVALSTVRLTGDQRALLVSQEAGFEHRKRRHDLVVLGRAGLRIAWSAVDPQGPAWSTVVVRAKDHHSDEILLISTFESSQAGELDRIEISRLAWDAERADLKSTPVGCDDGVYLAISRVFPSVERAIAAKSEACPAAAAEAVAPSELVLAAPARSSLKGYVLAQVSTKLSLARQALTAASVCWPKAQASLVPWCPIGEK